MNTIQKFQQKFWKALYTIFPFLERSVLFLHTKERQRFHLGWLAPGKTLAGLKQHLAAQGFGNHFVAWEDSDQVLSWRKLVSFEKQYHLRVFTDGEIRGHFELTPEAAPVKHFLEDGEEDRQAEFATFLGEFLTKEKYISKLTPDTTVPTPDSEITFTT